MQGYKVVKCGVVLSTYLEFFIEFKFKYISKVEKLCIVFI